MIYQIAPLHHATRLDFSRGTTAYRGSPRHNATNRFFRAAPLSATRCSAALRHPAPLHTPQRPYSCCATHHYSLRRLASQHNATKGFMVIALPRRATPRSASRRHATQHNDQILPIVTAQRHTSQLAATSHDTTQRPNSVLPRTAQQIVSRRGAPPYVTSQRKD